jgi:hypothetical protein
MAAAELLGMTRRCPTRMRAASARAFARAIALAGRAGARGDVADGVARAHGVLGVGVGRAAGRCDRHSSEDEGRGRARPGDPSTRATAVDLGVPWARVRRADRAARRCRGGLRHLSDLMMLK